jgi:hypothetical protein
MWSVEVEGGRNSSSSPCTSSFTNAISQNSLFTEEAQVELMSIASPKFDNLGWKF